MTKGKEPKTFVLVHGAWHGGWCWQRVADILRGRHHRVVTPTQTGLGERSHLLSKSIKLSVFVEDIVNVLKWDDLRDVVLVGHSFAGGPISGVADRMPDRISRLIYLDAMVLFDGESPFSQIAKPIVDARLKAANESSGGVSLPVPPASAFGISDPDDQAWVSEKLTPHPLGTYQSELRLEQPIGNGRPVSYIVCTDPIYGPLEGPRQRARDLGWPVYELPTGHDAMVTASIATADLLEKLAE
jgi:pimeloyl-ACP methyl ester carboxylesterase